MIRLHSYTLLLLFICCQQTAENGNTIEKLELKDPTLLIIQFDSLEIAQIKADGEDNFYTAMDDLMWYNSLLLEKMDSLEIPVLYSDKDSLKLRFNELEKLLVKDSSFTVFTYFYFDGKEMKRVELLDFL